MNVDDRLRDEWRKEFMDIINSPETRKRSAELHKALSKMTWTDYMRKIY
jgi:hypothetical protein